MRLWSLHPRYLDSKGLVALWREGLLAQAVLLGRTRGYRNHPQLLRFKSSGNPAAAISSYLRSIADEADRRHFHFDINRIEQRETGFGEMLSVTSGQLEYEFRHLLTKLKKRDPAGYHELREIQTIQPHPLFTIVLGDPEDWEIRNE